MDHAVAQFVLHFIVAFYEDEANFASYQSVISFSERMRIGSEPVLAIYLTSNEVKLIVFELKYSTNFGPVE